jgi:hypothetical protein
MRKKIIFSLLIIVIVVGIVLQAQTLDTGNLEDPLVKLFPILEIDRDYAISHYTEIVEKYGLNTYIVLACNIPDINIFNAIYACNACNGYPPMSTITTFASVLRACTRHANQVYKKLDEINSRLQKIESLLQQNDAKTQQRLLEIANNLPKNIVLQESVKLMKEQIREQLKSELEKEILEKLRNELKKENSK